MARGKCFTWDDHWAASWKNFTSFHSTPSINTAERENTQTLVLIFSHISKTNCTCVRRNVHNDYASTVNWFLCLVSLIILDAFDWLITFKHGLLLFGCTDESTDAFNHLTFWLRLFILGFFRQKHYWTQRHNQWFNPNTYCYIDHTLKRRPQKVLLVP